MSCIISVGQLTCSSGDKEANLDRIDGMVDAAGRQGANILVLPERILTGSVFGEEARRLAESIPGKAADRLGRAASKNRLYLVTGMLERDGEDLYNSSVLHSPEGEILGRYRKWHLFGTEKHLVRAGDQPAVFDIDLGRVALTICYDLVFPEFIRGLALNGVELVLNNTNWISDPWQTQRGWNGEVASRMAATRALENGIHLAMANRTGKIDDERWSLGHSCICNPSGGFEARMRTGEGIVSANLDLQSADWEAWRKVATYIPDRRTELYRNLEEHAKPT